VYWSMLTTLSSTSGQTDEDAEQDVTALVDKLRSPMNAQSQELRRYMEETILPVVQRVKEVHEVLEDEGMSHIAEPNMSTGIVSPLTPSQWIWLMEQVCLRLMRFANVSKS
jgi:hypothetical protein